MSSNGFSAPHQGANRPGSSAEPGIRLVSHWADYKTMPENCILCHKPSPRLMGYAADLLCRAQDRYPIFECTGCGLLRTGIPGNHAPPRYPPDYYRRQSAHGGEGATQSGGHFAKRLQSLHRLKAGGRILDVGCGDGRFLRALMDADWEAFGTEIDDAVVHALRRQKLNVYGGKLPDLIFPPHSFDAITYFGSFEHVAQPLEELEAVKRILRGDGILILNLTNAGSLEARTFGSKWMGYEVPRHRFNYTPDTVRLMLTYQGFQWLAMENRNDDFITCFSLACSLGLQSRYSTLERPLTWSIRSLRLMSRRFDQGNVFEVAARPLI